MPNQDGTGPAGAGSKTGGQMGTCTGANKQGATFDGKGKGMGRGQRKGRGQGLRKKRNI